MSYNNQVLSYLLQLLLNKVIAFDELVDMEAVTDPRVWMQIYEILRKQC